MHNLTYESWLWFSAISNNDISQVQQLLDQGIDIHLKDKDGWNALRTAIYRGHQDIIRLLLHYGQILLQKETMA